MAESSKGRRRSLGLHRGRENPAGPLLHHGLEPLTPGRQWGLRLLPAPSRGLEACRGGGGGAGASRPLVAAPALCP